MGKSSRRNRNRNGPKIPAFELLDIIPDYDSVFNYVVIEPQVLQYINTLSGAARDADRGLRREVDRERTQCAYGDA